jgi:hypothetical protein
MPGMEWITALKSASIRTLVEGGHLQMDLFDERDLLEIVSPAYPGERLMACRNPQFKVGKPFELDMGETHFTFTRKQGAIEAEAALDGIYLICTSVARNRSQKSEPQTYGKTLPLWGKFGRWGKELRFSLYRSNLFC